MKNTLQPPRSLADIAETMSDSTTFASRAGLSAMTDGDGEWRLAGPHSCHPPLLHDAPTPQFDEVREASQKLAGPVGHIDHGAPRFAGNRVDRVQDAGLVVEVESLAGSSRIRSSGS